MSEQPYRIFGAEASPYSIKVRAYFRYKRIPHTWIPRTMANQEEFARYAKLPLIPLVVAPDGGSLQDSTPIIEHCRARGVFVRHCATISPSLGNRAIRISVKDRASNARILVALRDALA